MANLKLKKAQAKARLTNVRLWQTHDRLVEAGVAKDGLDALTSHPDYIAADRAASAAAAALYEVWRETEDGKD
ncbi:MAG: hypothetical protein GWN58_20195 [Anaerolineae bacterium]|nr:hypothetical protein [Anaerolineae bacterium]